jgi:tetratricopeptide (TPR) repeat protein
MDFYGGGKNTGNGGSAPPEGTDLAFRCLESGRFAEAFGILSAEEPRDNSPGAPAIYFNRALCCLEAEDYPFAINSLEKALDSIKKAFPRIQDQARTDTYRTLRLLEIKKERYLAPMDFTFPRRFPLETRQDIIMALVHAYRKGGFPEKADKLRALLSGPEFDEVFTGGGNVTYGQ